VKIERILIENYRSIRKAEIIPAEVCALVGENNAGKTNVLSALDFLLGEIYPTRNRVDISHYYFGDTSRPIRIEVEFAKNESNISRVWCEIPWEGKYTARMQYANNSTEYYLSNEVREQCALVYMDAGRSLEYHLGQGRWTLFGRITKRLYENFEEIYSGGRNAELEAIFEQAEDILRTKLFSSFESTLKESFGEQLSRTTHDIGMEFRAFEPTNFYRSMRPVLMEDGVRKNPADVGQGVRNLVVLSLFRAYAKVFRGDAIIAVEEPETYLHPHAQRSLATIFDELADQGNQIFYSTHSGNVVDVSRFDRICLVERRPDPRGNLCTDVRQVSAEELLADRQRLYPDIKMGIPAMRERYRNIYDLEHNEAFFARKIIVVEGATEEYSLPIYAKHLGYDLDANGVSIVKARGKLSLDAFYQLYTAFGIPTYVIFDNDRGGSDKDLERNERLLLMLGEEPVPEPDGIVTDDFAIVEGNYEKALSEHLNGIEDRKYEGLIRHASSILGGDSKGLTARFIANRLVEEGIVPPFIEEMVEAIRRLGEPPIEEQIVRAREGAIIVEEDFFEDIPF
jgi:putative ATP-dependent endonuclease of the OLD family